MLPSTIRAIICGPSNCGKINVLISLIESPNGVRFENVYIYSKLLQQPKYQYLENLFTIDASHRAGNNAHDNEMLSIIEEFREAGLIIKRCPKNLQTDMGKEFYNHRTIDNVRSDVTPAIAEKLMTTVYNNVKIAEQQWYDPRLRYSNRSRYEFLNAIHHYENIWLPDTYFIMHGDFKDPIIPVHFALRIYRNGTVNYLMRRHLILSCQGRLNIFPFDDPLCSFAIESISYEQTAITYVWKNDEGTLRKSPSLTALNAYLIKNQTITCPIKVSWRADGQIVIEEDEFDDFGDSKCSLCQRRFEEQVSNNAHDNKMLSIIEELREAGNYSCLKVDLIFTRDRSFYFTTVFIPGIILVTSSFITFWLEWNAVPARVMIGVTTMLNFFTTSNGFRGTLPVVSNLTAMNVWDGVCMCFIYASLLEFVCVNYVGRKRPMHNVVYRPGENPVTQVLC
ncbi:GLUCL protein, partial [Acromyrmex charruanus]